MTDRWAAFVSHVRQKPTIGIIWPAKIMISLLPYTVWSEFSLFVVIQACEDLVWPKKWIIYNFICKCYCCPNIRRLVFVWPCLYDLEVLTLTSAHLASMLLENFISEATLLMQNLAYGSHFKFVFFFFSSYIILFKWNYTTFHTNNKSAEDVFEITKCGKSLKWKYYKEFKTLWQKLSAADASNCVI